MLTTLGASNSYLLSGILLGVAGESAQIVADAGCGECIPSGDADEMARAIQRLAIDRSRRNQMSRNGPLAVAEQYSRRLKARAALATLQRAVSKPNDVAGDSQSALVVERPRAAA